jgi:type I restriction enzyme S subunit
MDAIIDYRGKTPKKTTSGIPLITAKIIKNGTIQPVTEYIAESDYDSWMRRGMPETGDVVLTTEAPLGEVAQLDDRKIALAQRVITLRGKKGFLDNTFLRYLLLSTDVQHQLDGRGTGTTVKGIKQSELRKVELPIPAYEVQQKIAHILVTIDNKIQLNRETNQTLEAMAQALFKSWFVDFDPVFDNAISHNLANGKDALFGIPEQLLPHAQRRLNVQPTSQTFHHLFPEVFEQSDESSVGIQGWIPKGWGIEVLYDLASFINGAAYKKFDPNTKCVGLPIIKIAELKSGVTEKTGFSTVDMPDKYLIKNRDILFSWSGNPDTSIDTFVWPDGDAWLNQHIFRVIPEKDMTSSYLLGQLRNLKPIFTEIARDKQTTGLGHVTVKDLKALYLAIPDKEVLIKTSELLDSIYDRAFACSVNNKELTKLRDSLLPKLLSGELRIPDAEAQVEEAI